MILSISYTENTKSKQVTQQLHVLQNLFPATDPVLGPWRPLLRADKIATWLFNQRKEKTSHSLASWESVRCSLWKHGNKTVAYLCKRHMPVTLFVTEILGALLFILSYSAFSFTAYKGFFFLLQVFSLLPRPFLSQSLPEPSLSCVRELTSCWGSIYLWRLMRLPLVTPSKVRCQWKVSWVN